MLRVFNLLNKPCKLTKAKALANDLMRVMT